MRENWRDGFARQLIALIFLSAFAYSIASSQITEWTLKLRNGDEHARVALQ